MALKDLNIFDKLNNLKINVYGIEFEKTEVDGKEITQSVVVRLYLSKYECDKETIHLLIAESNISLHDDEENPDSYQPIFHFTLIKNLSKLVNSRITKSRCKSWFYDCCLYHFTFQKSLEKHKMDCLKFNNVGMKLSEDDGENDKILRFKDFKNKDKAPFIIYADLECVLAHESEETNKHIPHSAACYLHYNYDNSLSKFAMNRSPNFIVWLVRQFEP